MAAPKKFVANQVFIGLPWKNVRPRYERVIAKLAKKFPLSFVIVGRNDGQDALALFELIKSRIASSSYAVFDATGGNANVSLEYGYAEGIEVPRAIFLSAHKSAQKGPSSEPIISDLTGMRRVQYKTETTLSTELHRLCKDHDYTTRFEKALKKYTRNKSKGAKKSARTLALKIIHAIDGKAKMRRAELVQHLQAKGYKEGEIGDALKALHGGKVLKVAVGRYSDVSVA
jgi:hypothetical protein